MRKGVVFALALAVASAARAQGGAGDGDAARERQPRSAGAQAGGDGPAAAGTSEHFHEACIDLLNGRTPEGEKAIEALKGACEDLMAARAAEKIDAAQRQRAQALAAEATAQGRAEAGRASGPVGEGEGVLAAFEEAGGELMGPQRGRSPGFRRGGPVLNTLVSNPIGWFSGLGVNAELYRSFAPRFSWVAGARYSVTDASNGTASTFGAMGGADWYVVGRNNEGLRVGPRLEVAAGREDFEGSTTFARLGLGGELGYNFIASNGITGLLAAGVGGRVAGDEQNEDFASFVGGELGPYFKLGLGYSW